MTLNSRAGWSERVELRVDLTGSNCPPGYRSVDLVLDSEVAGWDDERIRAAAAAYYAVPIEQVGAPERIPEPPDFPEGTRVRCVSGDHQGELGWLEGREGDAYRVHLDSDSSRDVSLIVDVVEEVGDGAS